MEMHSGRVLECLSHHFGNTRGPISAKTFTEHLIASFVPTDEGGLRLEG